MDLSQELVQTELKACSLSCLRWGLLVCLEYLLLATSFASGLVEWQWANPAPSGDVITDLATDGLTVYAAGYHGVVLRYSPAQHQWLSPVMVSGSNRILSIAAGNGLLLAVGRATHYQGCNSAVYDYAAFRSRDGGTSWASVPLAVPASSTLSFALGRFWLGSYGGQVLSSSDGVAWTTNGFAANNRAVNALTIGDHGLAAVGYSGLILLSDATGSSWEDVSLASPQTFLDVAWTGNHYVACGSNAGLWISANGRTWQPVTCPDRGDLVATCAASGGALLASSSGVVYQLNIVSGEGSTSPAGSWPSRLIRRLRSAVGRNWLVGDGIVSSTTAPPVWEDHLTGITDDLNDVVFSSTPPVSGFYAYGQLGVLIKSTDGLLWSAVHRLPNVYFTAVVAGPGLIAVAGHDSKLAGFTLVCSDGHTWQSNSAPLLNALAFGNGTFVAASSSAIFTSQDAAHWERKTTLDRSVTTLQSGGDYFVGVSGDFFDGGFVAISKDGLSWKTQTWPSAYSSQAAAISPSRIVLFSNNSLINVSADGGQSWLQTHANPDCCTTCRALSRGIYSDGLYGVVGSSGLINLSANAMNWHEELTGCSRALKGIAVGNSRVVAVGERGAILSGRWPPMRLTGTYDSARRLPVWQLNAPLGFRYLLMRSEDLSSWNALYLLTPTNRMTDITDPSAAWSTSGFYRVHPVDW